MLSKPQIVQNVWRHDFRGDRKVVDRYVSYLRAKLNVAGPPLITTVHRDGYMLERPQ